MGCVPHPDLPPSHRPGFCLFPRSFSLFLSFSLSFSLSLPLYVFLYLAIHLALSFPMLRVICFRALYQSMYADHLVAPGLVPAPKLTHPSTLNVNRRPSMPPCENSSNYPETIRNGFGIWYFHRNHPKPLFGICQKGSDPDSMRNGMDSQPD